MKRLKHSIPALKKGLIIICLSLLLSCTVMIVTTPIHEAAHVVMSTIDPCLQVKEFHPFGGPNSQDLGHALPSILGCVVVKEAYPGAFEDRPVWADTFQEIICLFIQIAITCLILVKTLTFLGKKHPQTFQI